MSDFFKDLHDLNLDFSVNIEFETPNYERHPDATKTLSMSVETQNNTESEIKAVMSALIDKINRSSYRLSSIFCRRGNILVYKDNAFKDIKSPHEITLIFKS